jgi:hypothetical protein
MLGLPGPTHGPICGDTRGLVLLQEPDKLRQQGVRIMHLEAQRVTQGEIVIEGMAERAHTSPPGHGKAKARQAT